MKKEKYNKISFVIGIIICFLGMSWFHFNNSLIQPELWLIIFGASIAGVSLGRQFK